MTQAVLRSEYFPLSILSRKLRSRATKRFSIPFRAQFSFSHFDPSVQHSVDPRTRTRLDTPSSVAGRCRGEQRRGGGGGAGKRVRIEGKAAAAAAAMTAQFIFKLSRDSNQRVGRYR